MSEQLGDQPGDQPTPRGPGDFVELYLAQRGRLVKALMIAGEGPAAAHDLAQEAFARTYRHWRQVRVGPNPAGYLFTVAFRLRRRSRIREATLESVEGLPAPDPGLDTMAAVRAGLAAMPARQRACATLCLYLGLSPAEAADVLGLAPATVRVQLHRARQALRAALGEAPAAVV